MGNLFPIPPCPDPERYVLVKTKEGNYWRRKRGSAAKKATLNEAFEMNRVGMAVTAPAAKRIVNKLRPFLDSLSTGRITVRISGLLRKQMNRTGKLDYSLFRGFDLQPGYPIDHLLETQVVISSKEDVLQIEIPIQSSTVKKGNKNITDYFFEVIVLSGDCTVEKGLKIESGSSAVYPIHSVSDEGCRFNLPIGRNPWMAVLKVCCREGNGLAAAAGNYGMKVIAVG
jgi:hypothetical protein